ncbi:MAG: NADH-quinone oxidoreductase subunit C [Burkholderiales bacterium]|nr:NADH-quinone oxidoreductase subunit C [Burkholderiales bacterium]
MAFESLSPQLTELPGAVPAWRADASAAELPDICQVVKDQGGRLAALWGTDEQDRGEGYALNLVLAKPEGILWLKSALPVDRLQYPDLSPIFYPAQRMQRAARDLLGIDAEAADRRPWLRHAAWQETDRPLRREAAGATVYDQGGNDYAFVSVIGDGVHEIPVGPVHAGTIEPGHFRFSIVGEKVLRLEEHLGYTHKGVDKRFQGMALAEGAKLAGRVSGDSTVAYAWAFSMAAESIAGVTPPERALWLRALMLERERVANHLGDLGYLGNDGGLAFGLAQFMRLKEDVLRLNEKLFGHRYLMDRIVPGGVACDLARGGIEAIVAECGALEREVRLLKDIYDDHPGLQDRFLTCGRLTPNTASKLGVIGLAGRASSQAWDARAQAAPAPYDVLGVRMKTHKNGDVAARVIMRFDEIFESLRLIRAVTERIAPGEIALPLASAPAGRMGLGWIEGWRGESMVALDLDANGSIRSCHAHDPSWQNWPALAFAVNGNIVPDFPLINKSFNLSYSGCDL